jgi:hypothetical protein
VGGWVYRKCRASFGSRASITHGHLDRVGVRVRVRARARARARVRVRVRVRARGRGRVRVLGSGF